MIGGVLLWLVKKLNKVVFSLEVRLNFLLFDDWLLN